MEVHYMNVYVCESSLKATHLIIIEHVNTFMTLFFNSFIFSLSVFLGAWSKQFKKYVLLYLEKGQSCTCRV